MYVPPVTAPDAVTIRYPNGSRALVIVIEHPGQPAYPRGLQDEYSAECTACFDRHRQTADLARLRDWASNHAIECRALPQPAPVDQQ